VNTSLIGFIRNLPRAQKWAALASALIGLAVATLDAVALSLIVPTVEFMVGLDSSALTSDAASWFSDLFDLLGLDFTLATVFTFVIVLAVVRSGFILVEGSANAFFRARYEADLRSRMYSAILTAEWSFVLRQPAGVMQNALIVECQRAGIALGASLSAISTLLGVGIYLVIAFSVSWQLTLAAIAGTATLLSMFRFMTTFSRRLGRAASAANNDLATDIVDGLSGAKILKSHAQEASAIRRFNRIVARRSRIETLTGVNNGAFASAAELSFMGLLLGGLLLATRVLDVEKSAVLLFALLFFRLFQRSRTLQSTVMDFSNLSPSTDIVHGLSQEAAGRSERGSGNPAPPFSSGLKFNKVSFSYDSRAQILDSVNLSIPTGSTVALVGLSGSGKTTIIDMTIGLLTPDEGSITVDGEPLSRINLQDWRANLAYVSQDTVLFQDTIASNIARGRQGASDSQIRRAAELAHADEFINAMPDGYDTVLGDRGMGISGGQRQRLALARALVRSPRLLILDEATSELDSDSEARIQLALEGLHGKVTVLMAAHRLSTVLNADTVYVLQGSRVVEHGRPSDLLASNGIFYQLYSQNKKNESDESSSQT